MNSCHRAEGESLLAGGDSRRRFGPHSGSADLALRQEARTHSFPPRLEAAHDANERAIPCAAVQVSSAAVGQSSSAANCTGSTPQHPKIGTSSECVRPLARTQHGQSTLAKASHANRALRQKFGQQPGQRPARRQWASHHSLRNPLRTGVAPAKADYSPARGTQLIHWARDAATATGIGLQRFYGVVVCMNVRLTFLVCLDAPRW